MPRALISVSDKTGLIEFARQLLELGWDLIASGGTAAALQVAGLPVTPVEAVTALPEMLGGRVKTLHPAIHAGILARDSEADLEDLRRHGYAPISMVVCNLYPFQQTVSRAGVSLQEAVEQIDIGGVALLRAAAKNFARVTVLCDPADYGRIGAALRNTGDVDDSLRLELAVKAFGHTRDYDTLIHAYLLQKLPPSAKSDSALPDVLSIGLVKTGDLRYGENPHQQGGFYAPCTTDLPLGGQLLGGKALSYNNLLDLDAAWRAVSAFDEATVVIVKHLSPIGIASDRTIARAFPAALASDRVSAFGGVIAVNRTVDDAFVTELSDLFIEAIAAPGFTPSAQQSLATSRRNCRLLKMEAEPLPRQWQMRSIRGGFLAQTIDQGDPPEANWRVVTRWKPTDKEMQTLRFAWKCVQFVPSNAIVIAVPGATVGIGGGLPSRLDAVHLAVEKAGPRAQKAVLASDAFFPFPDGVEAAAAAGVSAIVQPGGSVRDAEVIAAADKAGVAMVFTGVRHFKH